MLKYLENNNYILEEKLENQNDEQHNDNLGRNPKKSSKMRLTYWLVFILVALLVVFIITNSTKKIEEISYTAFQTKVEAGEVSKVYTVGNTGYILLVNSKISDKDFPSKADFKFTFINSEILINFINDYNSKHPDKQIDLKTSLAKTSWLSTALPYLSFVLFLVLGYFIIRSMMGASGRNMGFGKNKAVLGENVKVKFEDVAGSDEEKAEMQEIVEFLRNPRKFTKLGARIPKGVLLVGPPGTGKTLLAKAIAGESRVPFYSISGSDFVEMFVGVGASRVRDLFDQAKRNAPCLVFIDEIDAVGRQRGTGLGGGNDEREQTLNQLLVQMDGFSGSEGIIVIAATNRPDVLDPALLRAGRFDRQIVVNAPDVRGRERILEVHSRKKPLADDVDFAVVAKLTIGFTGADLENLMNEAAIMAVRANRTKICMNDINEAISKVLMGPQKKSRKTTEEDNKLTAYHESGHTIVSYLLDKSAKVHEVSIIGRGMAAGYTSMRPANDSMSITYSKLCNDIAVAAGGRIAEELIFGDISAGASNDIKVMTERARKMVTEWGMTSKFGMRNFGSESEVFLGRDYQAHATYSEKYASEIDDEIQSLIKENYERAKKVLKENLEKMHVMAKVLLEKETIYTKQVEQIMNGETAESVIEQMNEEEKIRREQEDAEREKEAKELEENLSDLTKRAKEALYKAGAMNGAEKQEYEQMLAREQEQVAENATQSETIVNVEVKQEQPIEQNLDTADAKTKENQTDTVDATQTVNTTTQKQKNDKDEKGEQND